MSFKDFLMGVFWAHVLPVIHPHKLALFRASEVKRGALPHLFWMLYAGAAAFSIFAILFWSPPIWLVVWLAVDLPCNVMSAWYVYRTERDDDDDDDRPPRKSLLQKLKEKLEGLMPRPALRPSWQGA